MLRCTAVCRHVSHRVIYSPDMLEMSLYAMGSKKLSISRYARSSPSSLAS